MDQDPRILHRLVEAAQVTPPAECGMPDLVPGLASAIGSLSDLLIEDRDNERRS